MMFTSDQGQELINYTNNAWTTINNINCRIFYNKTDPYKSIFIPISGYWFNTNYVHAGCLGIIGQLSSLTHHGIYISTPASIK